MNSDLPEGWNHQPLESICERVRVGHVGETSSYFTDGSGVPFLRSQNVRRGFVDLSDVKYVTKAFHAQARKSQLTHGDLMIVRVGQNRGDCAVLPAALGEVNCANIVVARPYSNYSNFLELFFNSPAGTTSLLSLSSGSAQLVLNTKAIAKMYVPVPPPKEAREIGILWRSFSDHIALLHETNATLEAIAQAIFKSWFVDFDPVSAKQKGILPAGMDEATAAMFPDRFEQSEVGALPKGWRISTVGAIAEVVDCLHAKKPYLLEEGAHHFLQLGNIRDDGLLDKAKTAYISAIDYARWISRIEVAERDCLITNVGRVGAVAQIPSGFRAAMGRNMTAIRLRTDWPYPTYLVELLQSDWMRSEIQSRTDVGTILDALNVRSIPILRCVTGPHEVMRAFEAITRPLRASMELNLDRATALAGTRDTLLPRLISGRLRIRDAQALIA